ncbi:RAB6-interacting golgin-like isoform X3 [Pecten maximus]|uniref:RAB6-interacting golgin-like isoform X3 n=1 Tax=Pecten maximus TaxID=6579 RepID=UPI001458D2E0|nr:RAB6-interacting golgin-like isoform X3 [Pecten maximus]
MAGGWTGFSDEDLRRLKGRESDRSSLDLKAPKQRYKTQTPERRMPLSAARGSASESQAARQNLSQPKPTSQPIPNQSCNKISRDCSKFPTSGAIPGLSGTESTDVTMADQVQGKVVVKEEPEFEELGPEEALNRDLGTLEKFREQQKEIEEANKHKKALLAKTLSERQKKARMEAEKLTHIQKELMILDNLLSADVTVVRNRIEAASRDYMEATRRYDRAEKEFIEAKLDLQKKSELKEQLTEHLYTIIHQNEIRKAKKLSDLMTELDMETKGEQLCIGNLPPLSAFSSMGMVKVASPTSPKSPVSDDSGKTGNSGQGIISTVTSADNNTTSSINTYNSTSADQIETNLANVVVDLSSENSTLPDESSCLPSSSSNDIYDAHSEQNKFQGISQNCTEEHSGSISGTEDFAVNANMEQPSNSSCTDDSLSYNSALSSNPGGENSSLSPKHSEIKDTVEAMPGSWTLDSVNIKEEPVT